MPLIRYVLRHLAVLIIVMLSYISSSFAGRVVELYINGMLCPATADYVTSGIAKGQNASLILIHINAAGGLNKSMQQIVQAILTSHVPVVTYVSPNGAYVAKESMFLLYASTLAAMAPGTYLSVPDISNVTPTNTQPYASSVFLRLLTKLQGQDKLSRGSLTNPDIKITANDAVKKGIIPIIAVNTDDLLTQLNGKIVAQDGLKIQLDTQSATKEHISPGVRMRFLLIITDPTIMYLFLLAGIYVLFFEAVRPGYGLPSVIGVASLIIAFYGMYSLPINYAGLALMIIGISLMVAQVFSLKFGITGIGGVAVMVLGSLVLIDSHDPDFQIRRGIIWGMSVINILTMFFMTGIIKCERKKGKPEGLTPLLGAEGRALSEIKNNGQAIIRGEIWSVSAEQRIAANRRLKVVSAEGLALTVEEVVEIKTIPSKNF